MKKYIKNIPVLVILFGMGFHSYSQDTTTLLLKDDAVQIALENNYDIKVARNNVDAAENNASIFNSGYLPTVSASAQANYNKNSTTTNFTDGSIQERDIENTSYNSSLGLNYTLFDGLGRKYNYSKLQEQYNLSELQARQVIESTVLQLFEVYYEVARLSENERNLVETLDISRDRLQRAKFGYEYGQSTQLDVLNAEVDYNTDSVNYLNITQQLDNVKRNLNVILGRDVNMSFSVDTTINYMGGLTLDDLLDESFENNVGLLQNESFLKASEFDVGISKSGYVPKVDLNASYRWQRNGASIFFDSQQSVGPNAGVTLSWNIFDGGLTNTRVQNSKIAVENEQILKEQAEQNLERNVNNAWRFYQNALFVLEAQRKNLQTAQRNFDRTQEQNKLGQITSIEFRQAQYNLLQAEFTFNQAKYDAKIAELALLQLAGHLLEAEY